MTHNDTGDVDASLDDVLITQELARRPARAPDYRAQSRALTLLGRELVTNPRGVPQRLAELVLQLCRAGSAGISVLEPATHGDAFRWIALAGAHAAALGSTAPRADSPCGVVIERNMTLLFEAPGRRFASVRGAEPAAVECLLVPWTIDERPIGTVWAVSHDPARRFDAEDARLLAELSSFAAAAHQVVAAFDDAGAARRGDDVPASGATPDADPRVTRNLATLRQRVETHLAGTGAPDAAEAALLANPSLLRPLLELHVAAPSRGDLTAALAPVLNRACTLAGAEYGRIDLAAGPDAGRAVAAQRAHGAAAGYRNEVLAPGAAAAPHAAYALPLPGPDGAVLGTLRLALAQPPGPETAGVLDLLAHTAAGAVERHRSRAAQRDDERRQAYLLRLNDALRPLADPRRIQAEAARVLREHLAIDRVGYAADCGDGEHLIVTQAHGTSAPAFGNRLRYADYGPGLLAALRRGRPGVRPDTQSDPGLDAAARAAHAALGAVSVADVPLVKDGRLVAVLFAHHGLARAWSDADLALMQETAERTWAAVERAQAQSEREAAHAALTRQSRFVQTTLDALPDSVYAFDRAHRFVYVNRGMQELFGTAADNLLGRTFADLGYPADLTARLSAHLDTIFRTGATVEDEVYFTSPTGTGAYFQFRWGPVLAEDGSVEQVVGVSRDTTGRRMLEARLRDSEERTAFLLRLSDAMRSLDDPVDIEATATRMLAMHMGASRVLIGEFEDGQIHIRRDHVQGVASLAGTYPIPSIGARALAAFERGEAFVVEDMRHDPAVEAELDPAARAAWVQAGIAAHVGVGLFSGGRVAGVLCMHHAAPRRWSAADVNLVREAAERTWAAIERVRAEQALKEADRRKDEFLATLAHELRNPLAPISNAIELLRRQETPPAQARLFGIVERQVRQIVKLVDDLMEIARISRGKIELDRRPLALADIVRDAVEASRPQVERGRHGFDTVVPDEPLFVHGDAVRLTQVLTNLINNAAKYTDPGGRIELVAQRIGADVALRVRDNGRGIPAAQLARVFDMFAQPHLGTKGDGDGLGIGLAIVRKLVEMHGGTVEACSPGPGRGSEFVVRLPLLPDDAAAAAAPDGAGTAAGRATLAGRRILVVDDNADAADTLGLLLEALGAQARAVHDGPAALAALRDFAPHAVLLDLGMPGMDGFEVARAMRAQAGADLRIVALTGWGQQADRARTRAAGFDHHLTKPVDLAALAALLN